MMLRLCLERLRLFPAYAGVIPIGLVRVSHVKAFPRLRGGDPDGDIAALQAKDFSPPTRG